MSDKPVGGRGQKAPYRTVIKRIPEPIESRVDVMANTYRDMVLNGSLSTEDLAKLNWEDFEQCYVPKILAIKEAEKILKGKKSARVSLEKLLQVLYNNKSISLKDFRK